MNPLKYQTLQVKPVVDIGHRGMQEITTVGTEGGGTLDWHHFHHLWPQ